MQFVFVCVIRVLCYRSVARQSKRYNNGCDLNWVTQHGPYKRNVMPSLGYDNLRVDACFYHFIAHFATHLCSYCALTTTISGSYNILVYDA